MSDRRCEITACDKRHYGKGMCSMHYSRFRRRGDPATVRIGHRYETQDAATRLAARSRQEGDCLVYTGGRPSRSGHRMISYEGRRVGVHRVAYELANGPVPASMVVMHRCDNPPCIRPDHLRAGTVADNNHDRDLKGRHVALPGSRNGSARLQEWQVAQIKYRLVLGESTHRLAAEFGVHQSCVWQIKAGRTWKRVTAAEVVLAAMGADHRGQPMAEMPDLHRKALRKVLWPEVATDA